MPPKPYVVNAWADLVFHVLAHARGTAHLAPSLWDAKYVEDVSAQLGPASARHLGEDAEVLGRTLTTHDTLAKAQLLSWLFVSKARAAGCAERDLKALAPLDVDAPDVLPVLIEQGAPVEVLRCACALEAEAHDRLAETRVDLFLLDLALHEALEVAPYLQGCRVGVVPSLRLRGRVRGREIWVGASTIDHMAWQAGHEATVAEVAEERRGQGLPFVHDEVEREAVERMMGRAREAGRQGEHQRWLSTFRVP